MSPRDFQDYAELWQEQIGGEELGELQVRAKAIARTTNRRGLLDGILGILALGTIGLFLCVNSTSLQIKLAFALPVALVIGGVWRRHRLAVAARAIAVDNPRNFFESAIRNVRSELNASRFSLWVGWPIFFLTLFLVKTAHGIDVVDWLRRLPRDISFFEITVLALAFVGYMFFVRDIGKTREQLRRLETMRREWDDQSTR